MATAGLALTMGAVAGMRSMIAPAAVSWAAYLGALQLESSVLRFFGSPATAWIFTILALGELVADQLPFTPSRTALAPFGARLVSGALSGGAIGVATGAVTSTVIAGLIGAVIGTLGGFAFRARLAAILGDRPAALIEDAVALGAAAAVVLML